VSKFSSKSVSVEAHVVSEAERHLQVTTDRGLEQLVAGDAVVTIDGKQYPVLGPVFAALFELDAGGKRGKATAEGEGEQGDAGEAGGKGKGGQHAPSTAHTPRK
jgi:hypothetical protein